MNYPIVSTITQAQPWIFHTPLQTVKTGALRASKQWDQRKAAQQDILIFFCKYYFDYFWFVLYSANTVYCTTSFLFCPLPFWMIAWTTTKYQESGVETILHPQCFYAEANGSEDVLTLAFYCPDFLTCTVWESKNHLKSMGLKAKYGYIYIYSRLMQVDGWRMLKKHFFFFSPSVSPWRKKQRGRFSPWRPAASSPSSRRCAAIER